MRGRFCFRDFAQGQGCRPAVADELPPPIALPEPLPDPPAEPLVLAEPPAEPLAMPDEALPAPLPLRPPELLLLGLDELPLMPEPEVDAADFSFG